MKNLSVVALFFLAVLGFGTTLQAQAASHAPSEPGFSRPIPPEPHPASGRGRHDSGEEDEEDLRLTPPTVVDPGVLKDALRKWGQATFRNEK